MTDDGDICSCDVTEHIPAGDVIVEEGGTTWIADDVISKVDIVDDLGRNNPVDDTIVSCTAVDVDGGSSAGDILSDVTVDTSKGLKQ